MADVVLVKFEPEKEAHGYAPPFGILFIADALEKAGFSVRLFHVPGTKQAIAGMTEEILRENPLFVGFSSFTSPILIPAKQASLEIRKRSNIPIVWGGIHATILPEQTLDNDFIDLICIGEGEETAVEIARHFRSGGARSGGLQDIQGIGYRLNGRAVFTAPRPFLKDLDGYSPAWHLVDVRNYIYHERHFYTQIGSRLEEDKIAAVMTSRGCPWRCGYCYNQAVNKRTVRAQSPAKVIREIQFMKSQGAGTIIFEDDNFFSDQNRVREIISGAGVKWSATIRADYLANGGDDFVAELSRNGCIELRIGAESGSPRMLTLMTKDITGEQIRRGVDLCSRHGIQALLNFMVGVPGETWEDVEQTLDFMDELQATYPNVAIGSPAVYIPWPGTRLSEEAERRGFSPPTTLEGWARHWAQRAKLAPYSDPRIKFVGYYKSLIRRDLGRISFPLPAKLLQGLARIRWKKRFFGFPIDYHVPAFFLRSLRKLGLRKAAGTIFD